MPRIAMRKERRRLLSVMIIAALAGLVPSGLVVAFDGYGFDLGRVWQVREYAPDGSIWEGSWTRRGDSPIFDAQWRNNRTGGIAQDVIEFREIQNGSAVLYRQRLSGTYYGPLSRDRTRIRRGTASWYSPGTFWEADIIR